MSPRSLTSGSATRSQSALLERNVVRTPLPTVGYPALAGCIARASRGSLAICALAVAAAFAFAACDGLLPAGSRVVAPGLVPWAWLYSASACAKRLSRVGADRRRGPPVARMVCAVIGLLSWSELAGVLAEAALGTAGIIEVACAIAVYAAVAASELHSIARAAHDAWLDGS